MSTDLPISSLDGRGVLEPAVSWSAIFAGALAALGASIILTLLAMGLGLQLALGGLAPNPGGFTPVLGAEAIVIQVLAAALGGYLAGRLRHAWRGVHLDEAHFRDTAHGLVTWALSVVMGIVMGMALAGYADHPPAAAALLGQDERTANLAAQAAFFAGMGLLLSAFVAAVAARIGGLRAEDMHARI
jgi:hypothetical protein